MIELLLFFARFGGGLAFAFALMTGLIWTVTNGHNISYTRQDREFFAWTGFWGVIGGIAFFWSFTYA